MNGGPGALFLDAQERLIGVCALDIAGGQITNIGGIVNPDKLRHLGPVAELTSLLKGVPPAGPTDARARRPAPAAR